MSGVSLHIPIVLYRILLVFNIINHGGERERKNDSKRERNRDCY